MATALALINGIPRMVTFSTQTLDVYDETVVAGDGGITAGTNIALPNNGAYENKELEVYRGGLFLEPTVDYNYVGTGLKTEIVFLEDIAENERIRFRIEGIPSQIYDETLVVGAGGITTGADITLPDSGEYFGDELEIYLNGDFMEPGIDFNIVGASAPFTQVEMTFDLVEGDRLRFRIDR